MTRSQPIALMAMITNGAGEPVIVGRITEPLPADSIVAVVRGPDQRWWLAIVPEFSFIEDRFAWLERFDIEPMDATHES